MKRLVVQKYGGSVLNDLAAYALAARHVTRTAKNGCRAVAVVSALAGITDRLAADALRVDRNPAPVAFDLLLATGELQSAAFLALALHRCGIDAEVLDPWQMGLHTDGSHGRARITHINPLPLQVKLSERAVVIVPGFLGRGEDNRLTTLGRGGSDLTAVALADALEAQTCEFFKDVPGYFSADPRMVPNALHRRWISGKEAFELSRFGCRFLQDRAISWAVNSRCRVLLRALGEDRRSTVLIDEPPPDAPPVLAMTHCKTPRNLIDRIPAKTGPDSALISLVGRDLGSNNAVRSAMRACLDNRHIPSSLIDGAGCRLTVAVKKADLRRAQRLLHERLITDQEKSAPSIRAGPAASDFHCMSVQQNSGRAGQPLHDGSREKRSTV